MPKERKKLVYVNEPPEGLFYIPRLLTPEQHDKILEHITAQPFEPYDHHGYKANREVVYFGLQGGYNGVGAEEKSEAMPEWLRPLRERCASLVGLDPDELEMALVAQYAVGAGIGWHRDRPQFGPTIIGVSFASDAEMRFRRFLEDKEEMFKINLETCSAYVISGPARSVWQHGMNPVATLRYSITFRTVRATAKKNPNQDSRHVPANIANRLSELKLLPANTVDLESAPRQLRIL